MIRDRSLRTDGGASVAARDELAGVVDLFGALTRGELEDALGELAYKRGREVDPDAIAAAVDAGIEGYYLVPAAAEHVAGDVPPDADAVLAVGPAAFPTLPDRAEDLPHILDVPDRSVDRDRLAADVVDRLTEEVDAAIADDDADRLETLLDVCYDVEAWAPVDTDGLRERIETELA